MPPTPDSTSPPGPPRVKVCGVRDPHEALALEALGIEWIGFNFHPASARYISPEDAAPVVASLRRARAVGVFVDLPASRIRGILATTGIRMVQLHGSEGWDTIRALDVPVIKALPHTRLRDLGGLGAALPAAPAAAPLEYLLVDTQVAPSGGAAGGTFGGSGLPFDWGLLAAARPPLPVFLAGGLGPHNLAEAVAACRPFAVDLNSKVEISPGRKDLSRVEACLKLLGR